MNGEKQTFNPYNQFVGAFIPNWLMCRVEISGGAKLVYARLAQFAGKNGKAFPKQLTLSVEIGIGERQLRRNIKELIEIGLIGVVQQGLGLPNYYEFYTHEWLSGPEWTYMSGQERSDMSGQGGHMCPVPLKENHKEENQKKIKTFSPEIKEFVSSFQKYVSDTHGVKAPKATESLLNNGMDIVDKLIRLDGFTLDQVKTSIRWAVTDDFWIKNVLSLGSLRKKSKSNDLTKMQNIYSSWEKATGGSTAPNRPAFVDEMNLYGDSN